MDAIPPFPLSPLRPEFVDGAPASRISEKPGGDQVAEEDAGGDDDDVHEPVERSLFVHNAWG